MKTREECKHLTLYFGSGDYYVFCRDCNARWVVCDAWDIPCGGLANRGEGMQLSGKERLAPSEPGVKNMSIISK